MVVPQTKHSPSQMPCTAYVLAAPSGIEEEELVFLELFRQSFLTSRQH